MKNKILYCILIIWIFGLLSYFTTPHHKQNMYKHVKIDTQFKQVKDGTTITSDSMIPVVSLDK